MPTRAHAPSRARYAAAASVMPASAGLEETVQVGHLHFTSVEPNCEEQTEVTLYLLLSWPEPQDQKGQQKTDESFPALSELGPVAAPPGLWKICL